MEPVNNPESIAVEDLVRNMSSNEEVKNLCFSTFIQCCEENAPWIASNIFAPLYEEERLRTHDYAVETQIKEMRKMNDTMLIDCVQLSLQRETDFRKAIDIVMATNMQYYCERFVLSQPGDWPAQFYPRRIVYSSKANAAGRPFKYSTSFWPTSRILKRPRKRF